MAFLDRDGTLIRDVPYLKNAKQVQLLPKVREGIEFISNQGYDIWIVSNQSAIGRGLATWKDVEDVNNEIKFQLGKSANFIHGFLICPHHPKEKCPCRKPLIGLVEHLTTGQEFEDLIVIGNSLSDMEFGNNVGARSFMIGSKAIDGTFGHLPNWSQIHTCINEK